MASMGSNIVTEVKERAGDVEDSVNRIDVPMTERLGLADFGKTLFKRMGTHNLGAFAGNLAYSAIFAIFPFLIFLVSLLGLFHATSLVNTMIAHAGAAMPSDAIKLLRSINTSITKSSATGAFTVGAIISIVAALWGVSGAMRAVMNAMNVMYGVRDSRPFWKQYLISIALSLVVTVLLVAALVLVVAGPIIGGALANALGVGVYFQWAWNVVQWPVLLLFVLAAFALIYYWCPDVKQKFTFLTPGAVGALGLWLLFSLLFSLYVNNFGSYNKTYGALAGAAIFLLYTYYSATILLLGALANRIIEEHAPNARHGRAHARTGSDAPSTVKILQASRPT